MARINVDFFSETLQVATSIDVVIPESDSPGEKPVLYLLHGLSDDHTIWLRRTSVERYAAAYGLSLVMPAVARSYYADMEAGPKYWSFVSDELPGVIRSLFRLSEMRECTFIAGLSMGGYGALKMGLTFPNRFSAVGSFSGAVDPLSLTENFALSNESQAVDRTNEFEWMFGRPPRIAGTGRDLFHLAARCVEEKVKPPALYISCGTEDDLIGQNRKLVSHFESHGIACEYREEAGTHEWGFWDRHVKYYLEWLEARGLLHRGT